jgi:Zn-dependent protease
MDLKLGSIPIRIRGQFLLMVVLLGMNERDPVKLALWVVIVLVSITIHELGHALVGRAFGLTPRIELYGMGGVTLFEGDRDVGTAKHVIISLAGAFAGFAFALLLYVARGVLTPPHPNGVHPLAQYAFTLLLFVNIYWGVFNLIPMLPLDGGNILRTLLVAASKTHGEKIARGVSIALAVAIGLFAVRQGLWWTLYLAVVFLFQNVQAIRHAGVLRADRALIQAVIDARAHLERDAPRQAIDVLRPALQSDGSVEVRRAALSLYIVALVQDGRFREVMDVIERERTVIGPEDLGRYATGMRQLGRTDEAERIDELSKSPPALSGFRA